MTVSIYIEETPGEHLSKEAWDLLRKAVLERYNVDILEYTVLKNEFGKPYFKENEDLHFNLSHSRNRVMCILSNHECGCDVEYIRDIDMKVAKRSFTDDENRRILESDSVINEFFRTWTAKESYMKYTGRGFNFSMKSFSEDIENNRILEDPDVTLGEIILDDGYRHSYCIRKNEEIEVYFNGHLI